MMMPRASPSSLFVPTFSTRGLEGASFAGASMPSSREQKKKIEWAGPTAGPFQGRQATEVNFAGALKPRAAPAGNFRGVAFWI